MIEYIEKDVLSKLENRSLFAKRALEYFHPKYYTILKDDIFNELNTLLKDDDPYYKGFLYSILIRIYIKEKDYKKVVELTNIILEFSGLVLYEYCGKISPFATDVIKKVISCYDILIKENDIPAMWGKARILHFMNK